MQPLQVIRHHYQPQRSQKIFIDKIYLVTYISLIQRKYKLVLRILFVLRFLLLCFLDRVMKLLEVVCTSSTSDETFQTMLDFGKALEKTTVSCKVCRRIISPIVLRSY